jgi:hypothetical protein
MEMFLEYQLRWRDGGWKVEFRLSVDLKLEGEILKDF